MIEKDEELQQAKQDEKSRRGRKNDALKFEDAVDEEPAEDEAVGETKVRGKEQSSGKPSPKTQRKARVKGLEEDISPIVQKMVDEEVEKDLR